MLSNVSEELTAVIFRSDEYAAWGDRSVTGSISEPTGTSGPIQGCFLVV
jgi:hypothetical protein